MMRRFFYLALLLFLTLVGLVYVIVSQSGSEETLLKYQRSSAFSPNEMTYHSSVHPLIGDGVILYQPTFPHLAVKHEADKLLLHVTPNKIQMKFSQLHIDIAQTLLNWYGAQVLETFRQFHAPDDFLKKPLETLALLKQDQWKGDLLLTLRPHGHDVLFQAQAEQDNRPVVNLSTTIHVPEHSIGRLWGWVDGTIQSITITIYDINLLRTTADYFRSVRMPLPDALTQSMNTQKPLAFTVELSNPIAITSLFKSGVSHVSTSTIHGF